MKIDRKDIKCDRACVNRQRKRKFCGNQRTSWKMKPTRQQESYTRANIRSSPTLFMNYKFHFRFRMQMVICPKCKTDVQFGEIKNRKLSFKSAIT